METAVFLFRIMMAGLIGFLIGINTGRQAGNTRTFMIICMGAALITITSTEFFKLYGLPWFGDPARISAQIISALGFIGIGFIWVVEDRRIQDLPVAASLWMTAIMGLLVGAGMLKTTFVALLFFIVIDWLLRLKTTRRAKD